jgi:hypothetical protein
MNAYVLGDKPPRSPPQIAQESYRENHFQQSVFTQPRIKAGGYRMHFYRYFSWSHFRELLLCAAGAPRRPLILGCTSGGDSFPRHQHDSAGATDAIRDKFGPARIAYFCLIYATSDYYRVSCHTIFPLS